MSPEVWGDAKPRIQAVADAQGLAVAYPNEGFSVPERTIWLNVEFSSAADAPIEIGAQTWQEDGAIWLHIMLPNLTGIDDGLAVKDALSVAFRTAAPTLAGLVYRGNSGSPGQTLDPLDQGTDDGMFMRLTMSVRYIFQSRVAP